MKKLLIVAIILSFTASCKKEELVQPKKKIETYKHKLKVIIKEKCGLQAK